MWKTVMKNLLYFMHDLIPGAYSHGNWTKDGVDRAMSWAVYCEQIVKQPSDNGNLREAFKELAVKYDWIISFHELQHGQQCLFRFLIQNQLIKKDVKDYILEKACNVLGPERVEDLKSEAKQQEKYYKEAIGLYDKNSKGYMRIQTRFLLEAANGFSKEQLSVQLKLVITQPDGLESLIGAVIAQNLLGRSQCKSSLLVLSWLENVLQSEDTSLNTRILSQLSTLPSGLLCELLKYHKPLHPVLLSATYRESKKLQPCYDKEICTWVIETPSKSILKYEELVQLWRTLLSDADISAYTKEMLLQWCVENGGMVWNDVIRDLNL